MNDRRHWGMALAVLLLLAQVGSLAHSLEHQTDRAAAPVCLSCAAAEVTAGLATPPGLHAPLMVRRGMNAAALPEAVVERRVCAAQPRAPPFSN